MGRSISAEGWFSFPHVAGRPGREVVVEVKVVDDGEVEWRATLLMASFPHVFAVSCECVRIDGGDGMCTVVPNLDFHVFLMFCPPEVTSYF